MAHYYCQLLLFIGYHSNRRGGSRGPSKKVKRPARKTVVPGTHKRRALAVMVISRYHSEYGATCCSEDRGRSEGQIAAAREAAWAKRGGRSARNPERRHEARRQKKQVAGNGNCPALPACRA